MPPPAVDAASLAGVYLAVTALAVGSMARVLDAAVTRHTTSQSEASVWLAAWFAVAVAAGLVAAQVRETCRAECQTTGQPVACEAQRNCLLAASAMLWISAGSALMMLLTVVHVVHLRDALMTAAASAGPLATVWYWASTVSFPPLPRVPAL